MIVVGIFYLIILIGSILFYILFKDDFSFYVLTMILATPPLLLISLIRLKHALKVSLYCGKHICTYGSECPVFLRISNSSIMPVSNAKITIAYKNSIDNIEHQITVNTPVHLINTDEICLMLSSPYCGRIEAYIKKIRIYDFIKLFSVRIKPDKKDVSFFIYPKLAAVEPEIAHYSNPYSESDSYSKHKSGDDVSEIFGLHDYLPGDKISRIHWKASAKEDKLIVKDYSLALGNNIAFFICVSAFDKASDSNMLEHFSLALSTVASLSVSLCENEISHTIFRKDAHGYDAKVISGSDDFTDFLTECLSEKLSDNNPFEIYEEYLSDCREAMAPYYSHCIIICTGNSPELYNLLQSGSSQMRQTVISVNGYDNDTNPIPENTCLFSVKENMASVLSDIII